jgi:hypothetical protein
VGADWLSSAGNSLADKTAIAERSLDCSTQFEASNLEGIAGRPGKIAESGLFATLSVEGDRG